MTVSDKPGARIWALCVAVLGLLVLLALVRDASLTFFRIPLDTREGWNAYYAAAAFGGTLYPSPPSMMYNNYPPLSFFLVGGLGKWIGDNIVAGRVIALLSTIAAAIFVGRAARVMGCGKIEALFASLLFAANPWIVLQYAAIDDPQMLGHALGCAGLVILLREPRNHRAVAAGALLLTLAGFVKHLLIVEPLALLVWLGLYEPRNARWFALYGILFTLLGLVAARLFLGTLLIDHLVSPRVFEISRVFGNPGGWLLEDLIPLLASLYLFRFTKDRYAKFCAIYALLAVVIGAVLSGGEGVGSNPMFDASIAVALGASVFINRVRAGAAAPKWLGLRAVCAVALGSAAAAGIVLAVSMERTPPALLSSFSAYSKERAAASADIALVARQKGPVFCEMLSFCYWGGQAPQIDTFNLTQAFKRHIRSESDLTRLLDAHYFQLVQLDRRSVYGYSAGLRCAFVRNYAPKHSDRFGVFLLPRAPGAAPEKWPVGTGLFGC